ncbi:MAG: hypothetical protein HY665_03560 [Chloroflexi bacterium]|nr:hypothetical protein [Chloroflexota bacterium]
MDYRVPHAALGFLKGCYKFVNFEWQHSVREDVPDQGFERRFRERCVCDLVGWSISGERELQLGQGLGTASGVLHEIDIVARHSEVTGIVEAKNRSGAPPEKNDAIVFFAKIMDYLTLNPFLADKEICPVLMSTSQLEESGLAACLGLGIHPVGPGLRPLPLLIDNADRIAYELGRLVFDVTINDGFDDYCAELNSVSLGLQGTWFGNRFGSFSDKAIIVQAIGSIDTIELGHRLRQLNSDCSQLLEEVRKAMR